MGKLYLKEFRCVETTSGPGDDSPYFLIFIGNSGTPRYTRVVKIRKEAWDNTIESGELKQPDELVNDHVSPGGSSIVVVALMEEDDNADFSGSTLTQLRNRMKNFYDDIWENSISGQIQSSGPLFTSEFRIALEDFKGNDDILGVKLLNVNTGSGGLPLLNFTGDGGRYRVRFRMQA